MKKKPNKIDTKKLEKWPVELQRALEGDKQAAKKVLAIINKFLKNREELPEELNSYLTTSIAKILEGTNPSKALNLSGKQGLKKMFSEEVREMVAERVYYLSMDHGLHRSEGASPDKHGAYYQAALEFDISPESAERCFKEFGAGQHFENSDEIRWEPEEGN